MADKNPAVKLDVKYFEGLGGFRPRQRRMEVTNKDPKKDYRNVLDDPDRIDYWKAHGFEIDTDPKHGLPTDHKPGSDGVKRVAQIHVVMSRPKEVGDAHRMALRVKAERALIGPSESFKTKAMRMRGVEVTDMGTLYAGPPHMASAGETPDSSSDRVGWYNSNPEE